MDSLLINSVGKMSQIKPVAVETNGGRLNTICFSDQYDVISGLIRYPELRVLQQPSVVSTPHSKEKIFGSFRLMFLGNEYLTLNKTSIVSSMIYSSACRLCYHIF